MRSKTLLILSSLIIFTLLLSACGANTNTNSANNAPADNTSSQPADDVTPMVEVSNQDASSGSVTIQKVVAADPGWIVIHTESDGAPGPIVGYAQVQAGENDNVTVEIDTGAATAKLFAMLHLDAGTMGTYEFPGDDVPVKNGDAVVMTPFMITKAEMSMDSSEGATTVKIQDSKFIEKELTVKVGTTVTWVMEGNFPHTVTADDGSFDSGQMRNGETFSFTFNEVGEFPYYCSNHGAAGGQGMSGTITVTE